MSRGPAFCLLSWTRCSAMWTCARARGSLVLGKGLVVSGCLQGGLISLSMVIVNLILA